MIWDWFSNLFSVIGITLPTNFSHFGVELLYRDIFAFISLTFIILILTFTIYKLVKGLLG